jgi:hypothetical protein
MVFDQFALVFTDGVRLNTQWQLDAFEASGLSFAD